MRTNFTEEQLKNPEINESNKILRNCVHCGFCLPTCPTYDLLGDERDSPRGRIYMIQGMLESKNSPEPESVRHIDRCLSCLGCLTACPSGVDYMHLIDNARSHIEDHYHRPWHQRLVRSWIAYVFPRPHLFRIILLITSYLRFLSIFLPSFLRRTVSLIPKKIESPSPLNSHQVFPAVNKKRKRVALLTGCVQQVLGSHINEATISMLRRHSCEVVISKNVGCCGAIPLHLGKKDQAINDARRNILAWHSEIEGEGLDAIVVNASGCGTTIKDYAHMLKGDPKFKDIAKKISSITYDITEILLELGVDTFNKHTHDISIAYHDSCSMQHGQGLSNPPRSLLSAAGFDICEVPDGNLCCGAAGTYNILQPKIADALGRKKGTHVKSTGAKVVVAANLSCLMQIEKYSGLHALHTVELLDWATGGTTPKKIEKLLQKSN